MSERVTEEIGFLKLLLTIVSAIFVPFSAWMYNNFRSEVTFIPLIILHIFLTISAAFLLFKIIALLKQL